MKLEDLAKRIVERKEAAQTKDLAWKAQDIANKLGEKKTKTPEISQYRYDEPVIYAFARNGLSITDELTFDRDCDGDTTTYHHVTIEYRKRVVFEANYSGIEAYVPGSWEEKLLEFHTESRAGDMERVELEREKDRRKAIEKEIQRLERYKEDYQQKESKKWGL